LYDDESPQRHEHAFTEVVASTKAKVVEIGQVREALLAEHDAAIAACASAMAARFAAGGRLFSFGNGGSSTDAEAVADRFLHPLGGGRRLPARALTDDVAT